MADPPLLKDLVDVGAVTEIGSAVGREVPEFDLSAFLAAVFDDAWEGRALKQRIRHVAVCIHERLGGDYSSQLATMRAAAGNLEVGGIPVWCFNDFVEEYGVDFPDVSLPALEQFTVMASAEFAVRPFIERYPERMARQMLSWAQSESEEVRRLASEGYRPRLPWGRGLPEVKADPAPVIAVLDLLRNDPSETVRRSVANNLNDISKDHPGVAVDVLQRWGDSSPSSLRKHALRTLLKQGHRGAMELLGFAKDARVAVEELMVVPAVGRVGESVHAEFVVRSTGEARQPVMIDYAVTYQNVSGTGSRKVFKGLTTELASHGAVTLRRKISLEQMTTRRILPGPHVVEVQVNGVVHAAASFDVVE